MLILCGIKKYCHRSCGFDTIESRGSQPQIGIRLKELLINFNFLRVCVPECSLPLCLPLPGIFYLRQRAQGPFIVSMDCIISASRSLDFSADFSAHTLYSCVFRLTHARALSSICFSLSCRMPSKFPHRNHVVHHYGLSLVS